VSDFWGPGGAAGRRPLGEISGSFEPPLRVGQLTLDAAGVGRQEHGDAVPGHSATWLGGIRSFSHFVRRVFRLALTRRPVGEPTTCGGSTALRALRHARRMTEPARMPPDSPWRLGTRFTDHKPFPPAVRFGSVAPFAGWAM
jgi:hypothetical protein